GRRRARGVRVPACSYPGRAQSALDRDGDTRGGDRCGHAARHRLRRRGPFRRRRIRPASRRSRAAPGPRGNDRLAGAGLPDRKELSTRLSASDALAGVSMALVLIPQALAYAHIAGVPAQYGLYAAALPPIAAAF